MDEVVLGMVGIVVGTLVAAFGARGLFILLPLLGAVAGFLVGAEIASELLGEGLLATVAGWALAIGMGAVFAVLAGVFWYMAVVILAGSVGFGIGTGLLVAIGVEPGLLTGLVGAAVAVALIVLAILIDAPTLYIAVLTAFGGAALAVAGAWLLLDEIEIADLDSRGPLGALRGPRGHRPRPPGSPASRAVVPATVDATPWRSRGRYGRRSSTVIRQYQVWSAPVPPYYRIRRR